MSAEDAVPILWQICAALEAAHARGVVHRDLKPENVFLARTPSGREVTKILDFGIAKFADPTSGTATQAGIVVGTPEYLAPEQAMGAAVDGRADVYAVGLIAWRMLAGRHPFKADDARGLLMMQATKPVPPLTDPRPDLESHPALVAAVAKACAKEPLARQQSAAALREELAAALGPAFMMPPGATPAPAISVVSLSPAPAGRPGSAGGSAARLAGAWPAISRADRPSRAAGRARRPEGHARHPAALPPPSPRDGRRRDRPPARRGALRHPRLAPRAGREGGPRAPRLEPRRRRPHRPRRRPRAPPRGPRAPAPAGPRPPQDSGARRRRHRGLRRRPRPRAARCRGLRQPRLGPRARAEPRRSGGEAPPRGLGAGPPGGAPRRDGGERRAAPARADPRPRPRGRGPDRIGSRPTPGSSATPSARPARRRRAGSASSATPRASPRCGRRPRRGPR